jgi:hypothetical protein
MNFLCYKKFLYIFLFAVSSSYSFDCDKFSNSFGVGLISQSLPPLSYISLLEELSCETRMCSKFSKSGLALGLATMATLQAYVGYAFYKGTEAILYGY